jgi:hypothetical protein
MLLTWTNQRSNSGSGVLRADHSAASSQTAACGRPFELPTQPPTLRRGAENPAAGELARQSSEIAAQPAREGESRPRSQKDIWSADHIASARERPTSPLVHAVSASRDCCHTAAIRCPIVMVDATTRIPEAAACTYGTRKWSPDSPGPTRTDDQTFRPLGDTHRSVQAETSARPGYRTSGCPDTRPNMAAASIQGWSCRAKLPGDGSEYRGVGEPVAG